MRTASGRRPASLAGAFAFAAIFLFSPGLATAQTPAFTTGSWGTADGGAVEVKADGSYDMSFTDAETNASIFSTGKLISKKPTADGKLELTLKPSGQAGASADTYLIDVGADGNGELFAVVAGAKHKAAVLTK
jgi:hypothetical protein